MCEWTYGFQSQMRSQSSGDLPTLSGQAVGFRVSIADAKPILWRHREATFFTQEKRSFNRRCEANPLATFEIAAPGPVKNCFNRRCEANPLATRRITSSWARS